MREDLCDMLKAFGEERTKTCLIRLDKLMDIDTTEMIKINRNNWLPFSIYELDPDRLDKDMNILRLSNLNSIKKRLTSLTDEEFVLTNTEGKGNFKQTYIFE